MLPGNKIRYKELLVLVLSAITTSLFFSCQKIINVDLNVAAPCIVIEGQVTNLDGPYTVLISKSGSYFNQPVLPPVSGAEVILTDNTGISDTLNEINPGIYITSTTMGEPGRTYSLSVSEETGLYTALSTMHSAVDIASLYVIKSEDIRFGTGGYTEDKIAFDLHCIFKDPSEKNFYRIKIFRNNIAISGNYLMYDDQYTNGQETQLRIAQLLTGGNYRIELLSLDKQTFEYYQTLKDLLNTNPFFGSTPANPNSNLTNGALGYFGAFAVSSKTISIPDSLFIKSR